MIEFDRHGNPQPAGVLDCDFKDFKKIFVEDVPDSVSRPNIFVGYERYLNDFAREICPAFKQLVNGSFTTAKLDPNDVDLVNVIQYSDELNAKLPLLEQFLTAYGSKDEYLVDGYALMVYPEDDPRYAMTVRSFNYWTRWFGHDRFDRPKALIQLTF